MAKAPKAGIKDLFVFGVGSFLDSFANGKDADDKNRAKEMARLEKAYADESRKMEFSKNSNVNMDDPKNKWMKKCESVVGKITPDEIEKRKPELGRGA